MAAKSGADKMNLASAAEETVVENLGKLAESLSCRFTCGGELTSPDKIQLMYKNSVKPSELHEVVFPGASDADIQQLLDACSVASFGINDQLVTDTNYRNALKLDPDNFTTSFQVASTPICMHAAMTMMPNVQGVQAELYKLNIYTSGGFFKAHVDTPRSEEMFGSLVVCLPTQFSGGELVTNHRGHTVKFDWSSPPDIPRRTASWAVFFSDVEHEVLPVTQGHRITLTYNLYAKHYGGWKDVVDCLLGNEGNKEDLVTHLTKFSSTAVDFLSLKNDVQELICKQCGITGRREALIQAIHKTLKHVPFHDMSINPLHKEFSAALGHPHFMRNGGVLGFVCHHKYVYTELNSTSSLPHLLKGADRIVYSVAKSLGLSVIVKPVLNCGGTRCWSKDQSRILLECFPKFEIGESDDENPGCVRFIDAITSCFKGGHHIKHITWCQTFDNSQPFDDTQQQVAGYITTYGNEPGIAVFYQIAVILVGIPEWGEYRKSSGLGCTQETQEKESCSLSNKIIQKFCFHGEMPDEGKLWYSTGTVPKYHVESSDLPLSYVTLPSKKPKKDI